MFHPTFKQGIKRLKKEPLFPNVDVKGKPISMYPLVNMTWYKGHVSKVERSKFKSQFYHDGLGQVT